MDRDWLQACFRHRLPQHRGLEVASLVQFPRGSSRETWFVELTGVDLALEKLVLRRDFVTGSVCPSPLRLEFDLYDRLAPSAVPVAPALWFEDDPAWWIDGRPYYTRGHVEGSWEVPGFKDPDPAYDELRIAISKEHLSKLALLHTLDWEALGFGEILPVPASRDSAAVELIDRLETQLDEVQLEPLIETREAAAWLRDNAPSAPRVSLCKGTNGLGEEIFAGGRIVAMSDWELAILGDPAYDFAQIQDMIPTVEGRWGLPEALEHYRSLSGISVSEEAIAYYRQVIMLQAVMFTHNAARLLTEGDFLARLCWAATVVTLHARTTLAQGCGILNASGSRG